MRVGPIITFNAKAHYDCLSVGDICALPIAELCSDDAVLLLWVTDPMLPQAFRVIENWGFSYKTVGFYWAKTNRLATQDALSERDFFTGLGYWTRANAEQCLLATKGKPKRLSGAVRRLVVSPRREHSRKPSEIYDRIEQLVSGPYLELFARERRPGWDAWGDEDDVFENKVIDTRRFPSTLTEVTTKPRKKARRKAA